MESLLGMAAGYFDLMSPGKGEGQDAEIFASTLGTEKEGADADWSLMGMFVEDLLLVDMFTTDG